MSDFDNLQIIIVFFFMYYNFSRKTNDQFWLYLFDSMKYPSTEVFILNKNAYCSVDYGIINYRMNPIIVKYN